MKLFKQGDMKYNYKWTARSEGDDPRVTGEPDSTRFDRHEGYEMLYLVNKLAEQWKLELVISCQKIERMIRDHMPTKMVMQVDVKKWISDNWNSY